MHARVLTLRYSAETGAFDDCELQQLTTKHDLLDLREHVVSVAGEPCVILVVKWQPRASTARTATADTTIQPPASTRRNDARKPTADVLQGLNDAYSCHVVPEGIAHSVAHSCLEPNARVAATNSEGLPLPTLQSSFPGYGCRNPAH